MPLSYKILGQVNPTTAGANVELYKVPAGAETVVSSINICNRGASGSSFKVSVRQANAAIAPSQYLAYDTIVNGGDTIILNMGVTLGNVGVTGDTIYVSANTSNLSFNLFGSEIT